MILFVHMQKKNPLSVYHSSHYHSWHQAEDLTATEPKSTEKAPALIESGTSRDTVMGFMKEMHLEVSSLASAHYVLICESYMLSQLEANLAVHPV